MIIITKNPDFDYWRDDDDKANVGASVYYGTNNPMVAFRLHMKDVHPYENIDNLSDAQLLGLKSRVNRGVRFSEYYMFSLIPTKEGEVTVEEVDAEIFLDTSLDELFENNGD